MNLNEKHEREAYISRLARRLEHQLQKELITDLVADKMGLNDPYKFRMMRSEGGLFVPHGSLE